MDLKNIHVRGFQINKKADMGIGTLILFIAMLIVASITANVLVQTATSLQNRALQTGDQARRAISTFTEVASVSGVNISGNSINDIRMDVKLSPGSEPIPLNSTLLSADTSSYGYSYTYSTGSCERGEGGYEIDDSEMSGTYTVRYVLGGDSPGYIVGSDRVEICFGLPEPLNPGSSLSIRFEPQTGISSEASIHAPDVVSSERIRLYP